MSLGQRAGINKGSWGVASWWARKPCGDSEQSLLDRSQWSVSSVRCWWQFKPCAWSTNKTAKSVWNSNYTNLLKDWILSAKSWNNMGYAVDCCYALLFELKYRNCPVWYGHHPCCLFLPAYTCFGENHDAIWASLYTTASFAFEVAFCFCL